MHVNSKKKSPANFFTFSSQNWLVPNHVVTKWPQKPIKWQKTVPERRQIYANIPDAEKQPLIKIDTTMNNVQ